MDIKLYDSTKHQIEVGYILELIHDSAVFKKSDQVIIIGLGIEPDTEEPIAIVQRQNMWIMALYQSELDNYKINRKARWPGWIRFKLKK